MARPAAKELTQRELEVMHVFWGDGEEETVGKAHPTSFTVGDVRDRMAAEGRELAYTTVATLVRILTEKGFLKQTNDERPFLYRAVRSFEDVSRNILGDLVDRVFRGSREQLLVRLLEQRRLTAAERAAIEAILREKKS
jgi:BlaI family transcriptional regulator, penicillinase repressor